MSWYFVSDLHGDEERCRKLADALLDAPPAALLVGGDLLPGLAARRPPQSPAGEFLGGFFLPLLARLARSLGDRRPEILLIPGNDDPRCLEPALLEATARGTLRYLQNRKWTVGGHPVFGYGCIPPSPFPAKDWERYDVSHTVDPGCVPPGEEGPSGEREGGDVTIAEELDRLTGAEDLGQAVMLFHAPPYQTLLDRAALEGQRIDHVPLDPHVGSIAIRRLIERRQPLLTLHGHVHESAALTGAWRDRIGRTVMLSAAHDGPELALVEFDPGDPSGAVRHLL
ncbi:MAG TPA: metallophosphoesterase [Candidatus Aminicenantes bacterium]|nr:metallophosphoesterase [Candidatus Aminicenantes bacterium]